MEILPWLGRLLVLWIIMRILRSLVGGGTPRSRRPAGPPPPPPERVGGQLVRDPQCGTYVPSATAVRWSSGRDTVYFCSTACRDAYQAAQSSVA